MPHSIPSKLVYHPYAAEPKPTEAHPAGVRALPLPTVPGLGWLGYGYRPFGSVADPGMQTWQLFDLPDQGDTVTYNGNSYWKHTIVGFNEALKSEVTRTRVVNINEISREIAARASVGVDLGLFGGEISTAGHFKENSAWRYMHTLVDIFQHNLSLALPPLDEMRKYLQPAVREQLDIATSEPAFRAFLDKYGTHYIGGIQVGGSYHLYLSFDKTEYSSEAQLESDAQASVGYFRGSVDVEIENKIHSMIERETFHVVCAGAVENPADIGTLKISAWSDRVTNNPSWCGFLDSSGPYPAGLVPIYRLAAKPAVVEAWWENYVREHGFVSPEIGTCVTDIHVAARKDKGPAVAAASAGGYQILPVDLNKDAKGDYIYASVTTDTLHYDLGPAVTGLVIINGKNDAPPPGYTKIDVDLNKGAGGAFLYLCYNKGVANKAPIREVKAVALDHAINADEYRANGWHVVQWGYRGGPADANKDVGGNFIYLLYRV